MVEATFNFDDDARPCSPYQPCDDEGKFCDGIKRSDKFTPWSMTGNGVDIGGQTGWYTYGTCAKKKKFGESCFGDDECDTRGIFLGCFRKEEAKAKGEPGICIIPPAQPNELLVRLTQKKGYTWHMNNMPSELVPSSVYSREDVERIYEYLLARVG